MHSESAYHGWTAYCYPEQGMVDRLLLVHIQSQRAFGPWWTVSYNKHCASVTGECSILTAVDECSRMCFAWPLHHKAQAAPMLIKIMRELKTQGRPVAILRSDNDGVFCYNPESAGSQAPGPDVRACKRRSDILVRGGQFVLTAVSRHYNACET